MNHSIDSISLIIEQIQIQIQIQILLLLIIITRINSLIIIQSWIVIKNRFETNKQSMEMFLNNGELLNKSNQTQIIEWMLDLVDKISENGRNIYESNQINQTILEIDFDRTHPNESSSSTFWRFGISKYYQYSIFRIYLPMSLHEEHRNYILQKILMLDLEDLQNKS